MKPYNLKDLKTFLPPYKGVLQEILDITKERSVELKSGVRGFIIGNKVLAPFAFNQSFVATKDGHNIVLTHEKVDKWGVSHYLLPFEMPCEPLHYRTKPVLRDTFLFRVYRHITLCSYMRLRELQGQYGLDAPDQFCPVFDRQGHLLGLNTGMFCDKRICIPIRSIL